MNNLLTRKMDRKRTYRHRPQTSADSGRTGCSASAVSSSSSANWNASPPSGLAYRADALGQKAESLRKLADAWQPLYATLDQDQKRRMRLLTVHVLRELGGAAESRERQEETEED